MRGLAWSAILAFVLLLGGVVVAVYATATKQGYVMYLATVMVLAGIGVAILSFRER